MNPPLTEQGESTGRESLGLGRFLALCVVVGVVAGLGAIGFYWLLSLAEHHLLDRLAGYRPATAEGEARLFAETGTELRRWVLLILPAAGGLVSGAIVYFLAPEAAGHGTDAAIESYHYHDGAVRARVPFVKAVSAAITIGTGGSAGREGPIAQIGAGFGSLVAERLRLTANDRRRLMAAGMAAGIGAIFNAPLAGALFAAEVLYRDMDLEHEVLVPSFISSIVAYSVFAAKFGWSPIFTTPQFVFERPVQLLPYAVLAIVVAGGALLYIRIFYSVHHGFERLKVPGYLKPAIGGLIVGAIGFFIPDALYTGYGVLQSAFNDPAQLGLGLLLAVAFGKMATTAFSVGSGGSGGVFGPSIVIGGAFGGAVGLIAQQWFPFLEIDPGAFVLVGMAGFFAAAAHCPISTIIMVSEMTGNYHLLVPSMLVCLLGSLLTRHTTLYEKQLGSRLDAPSKMGNMLSAVLSKVAVHSALERGASAEEAPLITIGEEMNLASIIDHYSDCDQTAFPIINGEGKLVGMVDGRDIRRVLSHEDTVAELIVARDLARAAVTLSPNDTLLRAVRLMNQTDSEELIVVDPAEPDKPIATLSHNRVVRAYDRALFSAQN